VVYFVKQFVKQLWETNCTTTMTLGLMLAGMSILIDTKLYTMSYRGASAELPVPLSLVTGLRPETFSATTLNSSMFDSAADGAPSIRNTSDANTTAVSSAAAQVLDFRVLLNPPAYLTTSSAASWCDSRVLVLTEDTAWPDAAQLAAMAVESGGHSNTSSTDTTSLSAAAGHRRLLDTGQGAQVWASVSRNCSFLISNVHSLQIISQ
jgi:hypothetical protein